jgi:hypothetical protein
MSVHTAASLKHYNSEKHEFYESMGATGEWTTTQFLMCEQAWQLKRIADVLELDGIACFNVKRGQ